MDQHALSRLQVSEVLEAHRGGQKRDRDAGGFRGVRPGIRHHERAVRDRVRSEAPRRERHHLVARVHVRRR